MLRQTLTTSFVLIAFFLLNAQVSDYKVVDKYALKDSPESSQNINTLAHYLMGNGKFNELEKARSIYTWITHHIRYDRIAIEQNLLDTPEHIRMQQADQVLANRKGVCEGYANLYKALADEMGLSTYIVFGKVRTEEGQIAELGHAWVAIRIKEEWHLSDPTWGAGHYNSTSGKFIPPQDDHYFLVAPAAMIRDHYPEDPIWQLTFSPMTLEQWEHWDLASPVPQSTKMSPFHFADTLAYFNSLDTLQQRLNAGARVLRCNPNDEYSLAQLGGTMIQQGLMTISGIFPELSKLEIHPEIPLDTTHYINKLALIERHFNQAWGYLKRIKSERFLSAQQNEQPLEQLHAELLFARGFIHCIQLSRSQTEIINNSNQFKQLLLLLQRNQIEYTKAINYFQQTFNLLNTLKTSPEIEARRSETALFLARSHYTNAVCLVNCSACQSEQEAELNNTLIIIASGKTSLQLMKQCIETTKILPPDTKGLEDIQTDYPMLLARFLANESATRLDLAHLRFNMVLENPLPLLGTDFKTAIAALEEAAQPALEGLKFFQTQQQINDDHEGIYASLNCGASIASLNMGIFYGMVAYKLYEKQAKSPIYSAKIRDEALSYIKLAKSAYSRAKSFIENAGSSYTSLMSDLSSRESDLAELQDWWKKN